MPVLEITRAISSYLNFADPEEIEPVALIYLLDGQPKLFEYPSGIIWWSQPTYRGVTNVVHVHFLVCDPAI